MSASLKGEVALVTGSGRGLGFAIVRRLAELGANLAIHDRSQDAPAEFGEAESLDAVAAKVAEMGVRTTAVVGDISNEAAVAAMKDEIEANLGPVTILINCAGGDIAAKGGKPVPNNALGVPLEDVHAILNRNLIGTMIVSRTFVPGMFERRSGAVVNIASVAGHQGGPTEVAYGTVKAGIIHFSRCLASESRQYGVRVNVVSPGPTKTNRFLVTRKTDPNMVEPDSSTLIRYGEPDEIAKVVAFLAGSDASFIHGQAIRVDGGLTLF